MNVLPPIAPDSASQVGRDRWARRKLAVAIARLPSRPAVAPHLFGFLIAFSTALASPTDFNAPAYNWALPLFTKEGFRTMVAHGSKASVTGKDEYEVLDLNLTLFSGDPATRVETVILSPDATFQPDAKIAHGENNVRFIRDEVEASGTRWVYWHAEKKISLDGDVRVTFRAELSGLLK